MTPLLPSPDKTDPFMRFASIVGYVCLLTLSSPVLAEEVYLGCQGVGTREEASGVTKTAPLVTQVKINTDTGAFAMSGLSCWAGRGDCSSLKLKTSPTSFAAFGDGKLRGTGFLTSVEIDRRSGVMRFSQGRDVASGGAPASGPQSETADLLCQGGTSPRF